MPVMMIEMIKNHDDEDDGFKLEIGVNILVIVKRGRDADQSQNSLHGNGPHYPTSPALYYKLYTNYIQVAERYKVWGIFIRSTKQKQSQYRFNAPNTGAI